ncbi:hypothetical protein SRHO_G00222930 [Serrasalmus rhombeus]
MDDIFTQCREGNAVAVRLWLDNTENDLNQGLFTAGKKCVVNTPSGSVNMPERIRCLISGSQAPARSQRAALTTLWGRGAAM